MLRNLIEAARRWRADGAALLAAAVAYYATLSLFPLLLVLISGLGMFLRYTHLGQDAELQVLTVVAQTSSLEVAFQVAAAFQQVQRQALWSGPLGALGLLSAAVAVFCQFDQALDKIWKIERPAADSHWAVIRGLLLLRLKACGVLLCLGLVVVLIFAAEMCLEALRQFSRERLHIAEQVWSVANALLGVLLNTLVFTAIFRWLSKVPVGWLHAARGGLLSACTWELGRWMLATVVIGGRYSAYGVVGSLLASTLWIYYATSVLFLGAEYVQLIREQAGLPQTGVWRTSRISGTGHSSETGRMQAPSVHGGLAVPRRVRPAFPEDRWTEWLNSRRAA